MFKFRMKILLGVAVFVAVALVLRLYGLQIRGGARARREIELQRVSRYRPIRARRGRILARGKGGVGTVELVANKASFEVRVYYPVMEPDRWWIRSQIRKMRKESKSKVRGRPTEAELTALDDQIAEFWDRLSRITDQQPEQLGSRRGRIVKSVRRIVRGTERHQRRLGHLGADDHLAYEILEQRMYYPVVVDIDDAQAVRLRLALADQRWVRVDPSSSRMFKSGKTLCHILGRTRRIPGTLVDRYSYPDPKDDDDRDPNEDIEYMPGQMEGFSGLELAYNKELTGTGGWVRLDDPPEIVVMPEDGEDIVLTIDIELQRYCERRVQEQVDELYYATAGAAVVLDLRDNSLIALASVPTYNLPPTAEELDRLYGDAKHQPTQNRALNVAHAPGSIIKPIVAQIAFDLGKISTGHTQYCYGRMFRDYPDRFRCWKPPPGHGSIGTIEAISQSCDVFFYRVGQKITANLLADSYRRFGLGSRPGGIRLPCGLGLVPDENWMERVHGRKFGDGDARNLAIGQGDLLITPVQGAVMLSTLLTGRFSPVRLVEGDRVGPGVGLNLDPRGHRIALAGMERAVTDGTAHKYAYTDRVDLAGKTGSAQTSRRNIRWSITYKDPAGVTKSFETDEFFRHAIGKLRREYRMKGRPVGGAGEIGADLSVVSCKTILDGRVEINRSVVVTAKEPSRSEITVLSTKAIAKWPEFREQDIQPGRPNDPAHAWFVGYFPTDRPRLVIVVMIEYGMAGGSGTGPVFKDIALKCLELGYGG